MAEISAETTIDVHGLDQLFTALRQEGYRVLGPVARDGAIVVDEINSVTDLPRGLGDQQEPGRYRLTDRSDDELFGYVVGPHSAKSALFPARTLLWSGQRRPDGIEVTPAEPETQPLALVGLRACDLHAIGISDRVLGSRAFADPDYQARRSRLVIIAVGCARPGGSCFCVSMDTGPHPRPGDGYDLSLTELVGEGGHRFLVRTGSPTGQRLLAGLTARPAEAADLAAAQEQATASAEQMGRAMDPHGLRDLLYANAEHPRWAQVADRCLACGNCTQVCPTCFCTTVDDVTDLTGDVSHRWRVWDSCFTEDFSHLHDGNVRSSTRSRYRQWMTHKLGSWHDQFGSSGCVGCGRCLTWCPVGIDITAEVAAIRENPIPPTDPGGHTGPHPADRRL